MVQIFFYRIRDRICLDEFGSIRIRVRIFNIRYRIHIRILKLHIYDVNIQSFPIRHGSHYPYSNPNLGRNMKINVISVIYIRIRSVFIPYECINRGGVNPISKFSMAWWQQEKDVFNFFIAIIETTLFLIWYQKSNFSSNKIVLCQDNRLSEVTIVLSLDGGSTSKLIYRYERCILVYHL
jgi:hypothetical protein